jgi:hypothetical protein
MLQQLESSLIEKDVENAWRQKINDLFKNSIITSPYNTDGYLESEDGRISVLLEFKFQENLKSKLAQVNVLSQTLYYLKRFEKDGKKLPKVILIADRNECFILHSNPLSKYLDYELNWSAAASSAFKTNPELISDMLEDPDINPFVFDIVTGFNFVAIKNKVVELSENVTRLVKVTEHNINNVFEYFQKNVLGKNALSVNEVANLFVNLIINPSGNYLHPKRKNILITKSFGDIYVNTDKYISFFSHFDGEQYSIRDKENLTSIVDRIVEDETRRRKGEFFTPTIWVDEAHKMITEAFGENWKEEYVVWDPACGTLNLTRDYKFKELYCSTIEESDIQTADQMKYNPEGVKFQYDFLNDGIVGGKIDIENDPKLPQGLKDALLEGKKIIVLMNPPYGTENNLDNVKSLERSVKDDIQLNKINSMMNIESNWGKSSKNLYSMFLYRLFKLNKGNNLALCFFTPPLFLSGSSFKDFRQSFLSSFRYKGGYLMNALEFDGTSNWGLSFTIWGSGVSGTSNFKLKVKKSDEFGNIQYLFDKDIYNLDKYLSARDWLYKSNKVERKGLEVLTLKSAFGVKEVGQFPSDFIGSFLNSGNNIYYNEREVFIGSTRLMCGNNRSNPIVKDNFFNTFTLFTARKSIKPDWINQKDEYMAPNESHSLWEQFQYDSLVYSLFNTSSNQSSLRQIKYKEKLWDIKNEFFWMSKEQMMELSEKKYFDDIYRDARSSDERYVYTLLHKEGLYEKLSPDAKEVLDMATQLVKKTFDMREILHNEHPEYHLNTWDTGWYQIKLILKQFYADDLKIFTKKYKEFEDRMRPLVYELGFLRK